MADRPPIDEQECDAELYQIGYVAEAVGLSLRTIRYYDEVGLVPPSGRSAGGFRLYTDDDIERLRLITLMKPLEFTLDEMGDLLDARGALSDRSLSPKRRRDAGARLAMYVALARERHDRLRELLSAADALSETLTEELEEFGIR